MSLGSATFPPIPVETVKAAEAVFGKSHSYLVIGEQANQLFSGLNLGAPTEAGQNRTNKLAMLYLISFFQYMETLPDPLALNALDKRVDWKYALHLPLKHFRLEDWALCELRKRLMVDPASEQAFQTLLERMGAIIQTAFNPYTNLETAQVVASVCMYSRLAKIWETFHQTIEVLAIQRPEWLRANSLPHWYQRYGGRLHKRLNLKASRKEQEAFAQAFGADGFYILKAVSNGDKPELVGLPEITALRKIWDEQFLQEAESVRWREKACTGCTFVGRCL